MKKLLLISVVAIFAVVPAFADNITASSTCTNGVLGTYTGPVDIEANFAPNTINTTWYSNGSQMTVDSAYQTCTYDAALTPPTPAPRPGYVFGGWALRTGSGNSNETPSQQFNLSSLAGSTNANSYYGISYNTYDDDDYCFYPGNENEYGNNIPSADDCSVSGFSDLNRYEWKAVFNDVTVYGTSGCSETTPNGNGWVVGTPTILTESYIMNAGWDLENLKCWCHATAYTQNGGSQQTISSSPWVGHAKFVLGSIPGFACLEDCASKCAQAVYNDQSIRMLMFGN